MKTSQKFLLACGILAPVIYIGSDILAALMWEGYSYTSQAVSELRAVEAPTRPLLVPILYIYALLETAFGIGVLNAGGQKRTLRAAGILLIVLGVLDLTAPFFPMHIRENISASGRTLSDTLHIILTFVTVLLILLILGFGAVANGIRFRIYSYATIVILIICGIWASTFTSSLEANLPTPWLGVIERINIYGYMLWMAFLSAVLLKGSRA